MKVENSSKQYSRTLKQENVKDLIRTPLKCKWEKSIFNFEYYKITYIITFSLDPF